ncbi:MAG TPA: ParB N-terminal domain-containing protein, partial [Candidatus Dormibacteraeota bacterium]
MTTQKSMSLAKLLREFAPVQQTETPDHTWDTEAAWLYENHPRRLARLRRSIERLGIEEPIRLCWGHPDCGTTRHVVDGHHRAVIAQELGIKRVPVGDAWE